MQWCMHCRTASCAVLCFATRYDLYICLKCWHHEGQQKEQCRNAWNNLGNILRLERQIQPGHFPEGFIFATPAVKAEHERVLSLFQ